MYIVGQEEAVGESSVSVVAGVRTVTTNMDRRDALPRLSRLSAFVSDLLEISRKRKDQLNQPADRVASCVSARTTIGSTSRAFFLVSFS
jgi:hypothetical protein